MRVLDLFSGIGGFSLGLERAGMRTVAFCEIDPYCKAVLAKHWPDVPCHDDIRTFAGVPCDVICGGFPCQDISVAGKGAGITGARSGLWSEYARLVRELRPSYVIVENVAALLGRGISEVLGDLAEIGYDAEWHCIPASYVGAPHRRDRIWIIAYPWSDGGRADAAGYGLQEEPAQLQPQNREACADHGAAIRGDVADADESRLEGRQREGLRQCSGERTAGARGSLGNPDSEGQLQPSGSVSEEWRRPSDPSWWLIEPDVGRVAHGVPKRVDRLRALGNAVVPQVVEVIGRAIMRAAESEEGSR